MGIRFYSELPNFKLKNKRKKAEWLLRVITEHRRTLDGDLNYLFVDSNRIQDYNIRFLSHNYTTDIITFPASDGLVAGDILVCPSVVEENAKRLSETFETEMLRVLAHGVLHLIGYNDSTIEEQRLMREREDLCVALHKIYA